MVVITTTEWNFECKGCDFYVPPNVKKRMGFCTFRNRRVAKTSTCQSNPLHKAFLFHMFLGVPIERAIELSKAAEKKES